MRLVQIPALLIAMASGACGGETSAHVERPPADGGRAAAPIAALDRPRTANDAWPSGVSDRPLALDRQVGRRLNTRASRRYGLWVAPTVPNVRDGSFVATVSVPMTCLRVIPLAGPDRGGGGTACIPTDEFGRDPRILQIQTGGSRGVAGVAAPREVVIAGVVPNDVHEVRLETRDGHELIQRVESNAFVFHTTRLVHRISYATSDRRIRRRIWTCQTCPLGGPTARGGAPPAPAPG